MNMGHKFKVKKHTKQPDEIVGRQTDEDVLEL